MNKSLIDYGTSVFEYFNPRIVRGEKYGRALKIIGLLLTVGFILPYFYRTIQFELEPGPTPVYTEIPGFIRIILFYIPIIYGFGLLVYSNIAAEKNFDIPIFIFALIPFILLPASLCSTDLEFFRITGINTMGTIWLFVLCHLLLLAEIGRASCRERV